MGTETSDCNCTSTIDSLPDELKKGLHSLELRAPLSHLVMARDSVAECHFSVLKAERARALHLGDDVAKLYEKKAARENAAVLRLINGANAALKDRLNSEDWHASAKKLAPKHKNELNDHLLEARERVIEAIFESDATGEQAREVLAIWDQAAKSVTSESIPGVIEWLSEHLDEYCELRKSPEYGRQLKSSHTANQAACIAGATATYITLLGICGWVPFCWCCYANALHLMYLTMIRGCIR